MTTTSRVPFDPTTLRPVHPGEILRLEFMGPMNLTAGKIARACCVPRTRIERVAREKYPVTVDTALRLARFFATTPQMWMNLQSTFDLAIASREATDLEMIQPYAP